MSSPFTHAYAKTNVTAKALELFLSMIVEEASKVTLERGAKKVEAYHLYVSFPLLAPPTSLSLS